MKYRRLWQKGHFGFISDSQTLKPDSDIHRWIAQQYKFSDRHNLLSLVFKCYGKESAVSVKSSLKKCYMWWSDKSAICVRGQNYNKELSLLKCIKIYVALSVSISEI